MVHVFTNAKWCLKMPRVLFLSLLITGTLLYVSAGIAFASINISNNPQMFLDDYLIADMNNLQRTINRPVKHPDNPLITQEYPWESRAIVLDPALQAGGADTCKPVNHTIASAGTGTMNLPPRLRNSRCWARISVAKFQVSRRT